MFPALDGLLNEINGLDDTKSSIREVMDAAFVKYG
jgi:hypothetical protein